MKAKANLRKVTEESESVRRRGKETEEGEKEKDKEKEKRTSIIEAGEVSHNAFRNDAAVWQSRR